MGAAGRDYHNFLMYFKDNPQFVVVGFTAAQIPGIEKRVFPKVLAGSLYAEDIPMFPEEELVKLIKEKNISDVFLSYSDLSFQQVMEKASQVLAAGANFSLLGSQATMLHTSVPVVAVTAVRTGCGKSQTARKVGSILRELGYKVVAIRHPMPYGDLMKEEVQRFSDMKDLSAAQVTIEEREEYEPWLKMGIPVFAGVDYYKILLQAEKEADIIIWDGGNNDVPFYKPDLHIVVVDPLRPGHELKYYPGLVNVLTADVIVINKIDSARRGDVRLVMQNIRKMNHHAELVKANSLVKVDRPELIAGKRVIVVEDGPSLTHGGLRHGAGTIAALRYKGKMVDVRPFAVGSIKQTLLAYPHLDKELPAMGYSKLQIKELQETLNAIPADVVIDGSPISLSRLIKVNKPMVNVSYELEEIGKLTLRKIITKHFQG
ncbi:MAG: cyclic 2,3-diphosphoglycerate synthase [Nanoarchaeota archaeon]|nr:cyclic 2,3-diphosphoglycerate synthase [Nanoarchaeota archaeon]